jgi:hypothetical protein
MITTDSRTTMKSSAQRKQVEAIRTPYRTLHGWALGTLIEQHAVSECPDHGHRKSKSDPDAWNQAQEEARHHPFPGASPEECIAEMEKIMGSIGDSCPDC